MNNPILRVLNSTPINRQASFVVSQQGCALVDAEASRADLVFALSRLERKLRLMKSMLGVKNKTQHTNLMNRYKAGIKRQKGRPLRLVKEYAATGSAMQLLNRRLQELRPTQDTKEAKALRQQLGAVENAWRDEHPGCVWDGRQLRAPNGAIFSRAVVAARLGEVA